MIKRILCGFAAAIIIVISVPAAWAQTAPRIPTVTGVSPVSAAAGTSITITGTDFNNVQEIDFGKQIASQFTVNSPTQITVSAPGNLNGAAVDVTVRTDGGTSTTNSSDRFSDSGPKQDPSGCGSGVAALFCHAILFPSNALHDVATGVTGIPGAAAGGVGGVVVRDTFDSALHSAARALADANIWVANQTGGALNEITTPDLKSPWLVTHYKMMVAISIVLLLIFIPLGVGSSAVSMNGGGIARAIGGSLVAVIAMFAILQAIDYAVKLGDIFTNYILGGTGDSARAFLSGTGSASALLAVGGSSTAPPIFLSLATIFIVFVAMIAIGIYLLIRQGVIYVGAIMVPLSMTGLAFRSGTKWFKRMVGFMGAIIASKFVIAAIAALAISALPSQDTGAWGVLRSGGMLAVAAFSPFALIKVLGEMGLGVGGAAALHKLRRPAGGAAVGAVGGQAKRHAMQWVTRNSGAGVVATRVARRTRSTRVPARNPTVPAVRTHPTIGGLPIVARSKPISNSNVLPSLRQPTSTSVPTSSVAVLPPVTDTRAKTIARSMRQPLKAILRAAKRNHS